MLYFTVKGQKLERSDKKVIAANSIDYLQARFAFDDEWDGLQKAASFEQGSTKHTIILTEDEIRKSDHLNLSEGIWYVSVAGVEVEGETTVERITTDIENITAEPTILPDGSSAPESPLTFAEQLLAKINQSLYELAVANGFEGTVGDFLISITGLSAYEVWLELGNEGTEQDFIDSLIGEGATLSDETPAMNGTAEAGEGTAEAGEGTEASRNDHVHPSDTSRAKKILLAAEYAVTTYPLGEFCIRDNDFYECTTEITEAEAWNAAHWTQRTVGYVLSTLKTLIDGKATAAQGALADTAVQPATIAAISSGGVETGGAVSQLAAGPGQGVDVPEVWYISPNGKRCHLAAKPGLAAGAADVTHGQIDIVYGPDTPTGAEPIYVSGTPSASPEQPATPANGTLLAVITRYAGDDTIADADIEDRRDYITKPEDFEDETEVTESSNTLALDLANKHTQNFYFTIDNTTGKTVTASSAPYGTCDIILTIKMTATAAIIWTLDGRSTTWAGAEPTWTSGYTYHVLLSYSTLLSKWILTALPGAAN